MILSEKAFQGASFPLRVRYRERLLNMGLIAPEGILDFCAILCPWLMFPGGMNESF